MPKRIDTPEVLAGKPVARPVIEKRDLRIVLDKQGRLVRLQEYFTGLEFSADGSGLVLDLDRPQRTLLDDPPSRKVAKLQDSRQLPANCIYLLADLDKNGRIALESVKYVHDGKLYPAGTETTATLPATLRLVAGGTDSGFILTTPPNRFRPFRKMKEAPQQGYQREIVLRAPAIMRQSVFVFYCRVNGKYGKGKIYNIQRPGQGGDRVIAHVQLWLQPDGTRNLETMQCWW